MNTRVYDEKIDINTEDAKKFWTNKGREHLSLKSVLLGVDKAEDAQKKRNEKESGILSSVVSNLPELRILDIGCGIGRWAENFKDNLDFYTGIDYSKGFIEYAKNRFEGYKNINFLELSICDIDKLNLKEKYNLIICTGVLMYINDSDIMRILKSR